jgi:hypothetical protein
MASAVAVQRKGASVAIVVGHEVIDLGHELEVTRFGGHRVKLVAQL